MSTNKKNKKRVAKILVTWDEVEGEEQASFDLKFTPALKHMDTDIRNHLVLLANAFNSGVRQLMNAIKPLPQPTEEELESYTYNFEEHGKEHGEGLFALYNYKKALMEEFVAIVERTLPDAFHDVLFVKGAQEKIFEQLRKERREKEEFEEEFNDEIKKEEGAIN